MGRRQTITAGREQLVVRPWHADERVAYLLSQPVSSAPSVGALESALSAIRDMGYTSVITSALHYSEAESFVRTGFIEFDRLIVLAHDLSGLDRVPREARSSVRLRRARRRDRVGALRVDANAFQPYWRLDEEGLDEALHATSRTRFRVAEMDGDIVGYSVTGRAMSQGFLQRLATDPQIAGRGIGTALVMDSLRWCRQRRASCALVNTQSTNQRALDLYRHLGFKITPALLVVMTRDLA